MRQQKWKSLQNNFKSLKSKFGLKIPSHRTNQFQKPKTIDYTLDSLRTCSRQFPQYLYHQLQNPKSQFHNVIKETNQNLWKADKKQALQFLQFLFVWNLKNQQIAQRALSGFSFTFFQIFSIMKWYPYNHFIQKIILERLNKMNPSQYEPLFRIINYLRYKDLGNQSFFFALQRNLIQNFNSIPPSSLTQIAVHYANSIKQEHDTKIHILNLIRQRLTKNIKFLSSQELIAVMYSYVRNDLMTTQLLTAIAIRIQLNYYQFPPYIRKKIFNILSNFPQLQTIRILGIAQKQFLKQKTIHFTVLPQFYLASFQAGMLTQQLINQFNNQILQNILNMDSQDVSKSIWVFYRTSKQKQCLQMNKKLQIIIQGGLRNYKIKQVSVIVWGLCLIPKYVQDTMNNRFWKNIEHYIQQRIYKEDNCVQNCGYILWAYLNNRPLTKKTVSIISQLVITHKQSIQPFSLVNIISFYYTIESKNIQVSQIQIIKPILIESFTQLLTQMRMIEIIKCLRYVEADISNQTFLQSLKILENCIQQLKYKDCLSLMGILINSQRQSKIKQSLVVKLANKIRQFQSITPTTL